MLLLIALSGCSQPAPKWEYKTEIVAVTDRDDTLARRGAEGWELVSSQSHRKGSQAEIEALDTQVADFPLKIQMNCDPAVKIAGDHIKMRKIIEADFALMQNVDKDPKKVAVALELIKPSLHELRAAAKEADSPLGGAVAENYIQQAVEEGENYLRILHRKEDAESEVADLSFKRRTN